MESHSRLCWRTAQLQTFDGHCGPIVKEECTSHSCGESIRDSTRCLRKVFLPSRRFEHGRRRVDLLRVHRGNNPDQLFGVGALAHRRLPPRSGVCAGMPLALLALHFSAREGCPGHCDTLIGFFIPDGSEKFPKYQLLVSRLLNAAFWQLVRRQLHAKKV